MNREYIVKPKTGVIFMENRGNLITTESTSQPTKLYTRRKFIGLGLIGTLGLTGGISVIDKVFGEQATDKSGQATLN